MSGLPAPEVFSMTLTSSYEQLLVCGNWKYRYARYQEASEPKFVGSGTKDLISEKYKGAQNPAYMKTLVWSFVSGKQ